MTDEYLSRNFLVLRHHEVSATRDGSVVLILLGTVAGQPREIAAVIMQPDQADALAKALRKEATEAELNAELGVNTDDDGRN